MPGSQVTLQELRTFADNIGRKKLATRERGLLFEFWSDDEGFHYIPDSTGKHRRNTFNAIENVLERFNSSRSLRPGAYADLTVNASYLMVILGKYVHSEG